MIAALPFSDHSYIADTHVHVPLWQVDGFSFAYDQHDVTPVLKDNSQTQLLETRNRAEANYQLNDSLRLIGIGGYHHTGFEDRAGRLGAYEIGGGIGSAVGREVPRFSWSVVAGGTCPARTWTPTGGWTCTRTGAFTNSGSAG